MVKTAEERAAMPAPDAKEGAGGAPGGVCPANRHGSDATLDERAEAASMHIDSTPHASPGNGEADQAGSFSFAPLPDPMDYGQMVEHLVGKGLAVGDGERPLIAARLGEVDYYRLRGYWLTLEHAETQGDRAVRRFDEGTSFDDIWEVYALDAQLRNWLWRATGPVEVKLRSQFAQHVALAGGPLGHEDPANFKDATAHAASMNGYRRERKRALRDGVPFVVHGMGKFGTLPVWSAVDVMTLGTLSQLYGNLSGTLAYEGGPTARSAIAAGFGLKSRYLQSWLRHLTYVRNLCGHHNRVYNRVMTVRPTLLQEDSGLEGAKQFPTFLVIKQMYKRSWPDRWDGLLAGLEAVFEAHPSVDLGPMGFPESWEELLA